MPKRTLIACALAGAALLAGTAGAATVQPVTWAAQTCTSLSTWQHALARRTAALGQSPATTHRQLLATLAQLRADGIALGKAIDLAGTPAVPQGPAIQATIKQSVTAFNLALVRDVQRAGSLSAAAEFAAITSQGKAVGSAFIQLGTTYHQPLLDQAIDQVPACALVHG